MRLKELRAERGLSQKDVSDALDCSITVYSRYETGAREPSIDVLIRLADFYQVTLDELVGRPPMKVVPLEGDPPEEMEGYHHIVFEPDEQLDENDMTPLIRKILAEERFALYLATTCLGTEKARPVTALSS